MGELSKIQFLAVAAIPVLFAITVHEVAHGWVAKKLGDPTAMMMGRLTLNPIKHIDLVGTVVVPVVVLMLTGFLFGWAKPVPITWENLKRPKRDIGLVAIAGPAANLLMIIIWAIVMKLALFLPIEYRYFGQPLVYMGVAGIFINGILMVLNLLPMPPLDGGRIATSLLPGPIAWKFSRIEPFGMVILVVLLVTGVLWTIMLPILVGVLKAVAVLFGLQSELSVLLGL